MDFRTGDDAAMDLEQETATAVDVETKKKSSSSKKKKKEKVAKTVVAESEDKGVDIVAEKAGQALAGAMAAAVSSSVDGEKKKVNDRRFNVVKDDSCDEI